MARFVRASEGFAVLLGPGADGSGSVFDGSAERAGASGRVYRPPVVFGEVSRRTWRLNGVATEPWLFGGTFWLRFSYDFTYGLCAGMKMNALWWWIDRWRKSTAYTDMTLEEQGAYRNLLDEATLRSGTLPDNERVLAKACGDAKVWRRLRAVVLARFDLRADGWHNETLDGVLAQSKRRAKNQANYRQRGDNKADNTLNNKSNNKPGNKPVYPDPDLYPTDSIKSVESEVPRARATGNGANEPGSLPRDHIHHSICGPSMRICLKTWECGELMTQYGGDPSKQKAGVVAFVEAFEGSLGPDDSRGDFRWLEKHFQAWLHTIGRAPVAPSKPIEVSRSPAQIAEAIERKRAARS